MARKEQKFQRACGGAETERNPGVPAVLPRDPQKKSSIINTKKPAPEGSSQKPRFLALNDAVDQSLSVIDHCDKNLDLSAELKNFEAHDALALKSPGGARKGDEDLWSIVKGL